MMPLTASPGSVIVPAAYALAFAVLLAPAYALAHVIVHRYALVRAATPMLAFAGASLAGYLAFWCYLFSPLLGRVVSFGWAVAAIAAIVALRRAKPTREEALQLALTFAVGLFYLAVLYLPATTIDAGARFFVLRPGDNVIPSQFAEQVFQGHDPRHFQTGWLSSDRPPLQTGLLLLLRPLFRLAPAYAQNFYEIGGLIAQLAWVPAAWLLCARARFSARQRAFSLALAIFSGFFLYNTVYVWPKLLAAGMSIAALVFLLPEHRQNRTVSLTLAGVCAALAMLAHGSAVFLLAPALLVLLAFRRLRPDRGLAWAALAFVLLNAPWSAYQKFYDPPGDRLIKMHLAGVQDVDPRSALAAIAQAYETTPPAVIAQNKLANVQTALGLAPLMESATIAEPPTPLNDWRLQERELVTTALGVVNLGVIALPWWWSRRAVFGPAERNGAALLALAVVSILFWCLAMWGPGATVTTHGAYAVELLLFLVLGAALATLPVPLAFTVLGLAVLDLVVTWIVGSLPDAWRVAPALDPLMAVLALAAAAAVGLLLARDARYGVGEEEAAVAGVATG